MNGIRREASFLAVFVIIMQRAAFAGQLRRPTHYYCSDNNKILQTMIHKRLRFFVLILCAGLCCCTRSKQLSASDDKETTPQLASATQADSRELIAGDIYESTVRYQFEHNGTGDKIDTSSSYKACFLSVNPGSKEVLQGYTYLDDLDPTDEFINRFKDHEPPVRKYSQCQKTPGVTDRETGERGLIFRLGEIRWISDSEVEVAGGYYSHPHSGSGNTYYLKRSSGKWIVQKDIMHWIS